MGTPALPQKGYPVLPGAEASSAYTSTFESLPSGEQESSFMVVSEPHAQGLESLAEQRFAELSSKLDMTRQSMGVLSKLLVRLAYWCIRHNGKEVPQELSALLAEAQACQDLQPGDGAMRECPIQAGDEAGASPLKELVEFWKAQALLNSKASQATGEELRQSQARTRELERKLEDSEVQMKAKDERMAEAKEELGRTQARAVATEQALETKQAELSGAQARADDAEQALAAKEAELERQQQQMQVALKELNLEQKDSYGWTPLMYATYKGHLDTVRLLIEKGADVNAKNKGGWTPLILAAGKVHLDVARLLTDKGADVNAKTDDGWTPLMWAAFEGHLDIVRLLVDKGAYVNAKDNGGNTALDVAKIFNHVQVVLYLEPLTAAR